jgi:prepilin-type N-terminal cleavage/methylation domain-containing protein
MKSPKTSPRDNSSGFTIIEIIISVGILLVLASLGLFISMDFYRSYSLNYEENLVVGIIQRARSQAMANIDQTQHGACLIGSNYMISEGSTCTGGATFPKANAAKVTWPTPIIFNQLDGTCSACPLTVTISSSGKASASININNEGRIDW